MYYKVWFYFGRNYEFKVKIDTRQKKKDEEQIFLSFMMHWILILNVDRGFGVLNAHMKAGALL